ncbi:protein PIH1D3 [Bombyx mandarina]|uniref:Protein PIH1D3 n=1 Tax=Bombyx mandarina TaxID=7092 RepID=A0A6J2K0Y9_BOMMA|nr:protein PIH1D3 [Bombyx mandarina]
MEFSPSTMEKLAELFRPPEPDVFQGEDFTPTEYEITSVRGKIPATERDPKDPKTIEEYEELEDRAAEDLCRIGAGLDDRKTPQYTMNYQQSVSAEDVFLQIGPKTPSSASCENIVIRIKMPGDKKENVDLNVDRTTVTVNSSQYTLNLPLPHGVDPDLSKANWDTAEDMLVLTLKLDREFDFVNF